MGWDKVRAYKILCLIIGCLSELNSGSFLSFTVYSGAIKDKFNYTEAQVEVMSSVVSLGFGMVFIPGIIYDRYGPKTTLILGFIMSVVSYILLWSTTEAIQFYSRNSWLMAIYFFTCGFGLSCTYIAGLSTNLLNFDKQYAGKISGVLVAFFWIGNFVYNGIYYSFFVNGDPSNFVNHNLGGFMILFAVCVGVVDIAGIIFLKNVGTERSEFKPLKEEENETHELSEIKDSGKPVVSYDTYTDHLGVESPNQDEEVEDCSERTNEDSSETNTRLQRLRNPMTVKEAFLCLDLQIMVWMVAFARSVSLVFGINITVMTRSLGLDYFDDRLTVIIPIERGIITLVMGFFSDFFIQKISRMAIIIFSTILGLLSQTVMFLFANILWTLVLSSVTLALSMSIFSPVTPTIVRETFYVGNFGRNWGLAVMLGEILGCGFLELSGILYDYQIKGTGETLCFGMKCIRGSMGISLALTAVTLIFSIIIYRRIQWGQK